jgi:PAT family beta-lactamase induction signal transducer AmpG
MENNFDYKFRYTGIFSLNYFIQGINQSMFAAVIPIYLFTLVNQTPDPTDYVDPAALSFMLSFVFIPFIFKLVYGILGDKIRSRKIGRRKPWIVGGASFSGLMWIIISILLLTKNSSNVGSVMALFTYEGVFVVLGVAIADTSMDGFIIDICPKELLGRTTGMVWACRSVGIIVGGPVILLSLGVIPIISVFIFLGGLTILFSILTFTIKDRLITEEINLVANLKVMFKKRENWKVYIFSFFMAIVDGVIFVFLALFILIQLGLPVPLATSALETDESLYPPQAFITFLTGMGVLTGALIGGVIADKISRRTSFFGSIILTAGALALLLIPIPEAFIMILLVFAVIVGSSSGWRNSAFSAVATQYSKQYPETPSTYFSICTSFINLGTQLGLLTTGLVFSRLTGISTDVILIFGIVFLTMMILSSLAIIPFLFLDRSQYEVKSQK